MLQLDQLCARTIRTTEGTSFITFASTDNKFFFFACERKYIEEYRSKNKIENN